VDHFSKYTFLKAMKEATASNVVNFLVNEVFYKFGVPETIHSDNGKQFVSKAFEEMIDGFGIQHMRTPVYSPQSNAAERVNRNVLAAIRSFLDEDHPKHFPLSHRRCAVLHRIRPSHVPQRFQLQTSQTTQVSGRP